MTSSDLQKFAADTNADIVGGVREDALNRYAAKHFAQFPDIYKGGGSADALDIKYQFAVTAPVVFHLTEVANGADLLKRRVLSDPFLHYNKSLFRDVGAAPVITIDLQKTTVTFSTLAGQHLADITISGSVSTAVLVDPTPPGTYKLQVVKVDIHIDSRTLSTETHAAGCDLNKLIEHILDSMLKDSLTRFLHDLPLPQPHFALAGILVQLQSIAVSDKTLLLSLAARLASRGQLLLDGNAIHGEAMERAVFGNPLPRAIDTSKPGEVTGTLDLTKGKRPTSLDEVRFSGLAGNNLPKGDLFLSLSQRVFQLLADKYLNIEKEEEKQSDGYAYYFYKYGYKVWGPLVAVVDSGLEIAAQLAGNASGGAGLKGCSSWIKVELGADAKAVPGAKITAQLRSGNGGKELWVHPFDFPFAIVAHAYMKPYVPGLDFVLSLIVSSLLTFFSGVILPLISLLLEIKLVTLPNSVPGTPVAATPLVDTVGNWNGMLYIGVDLKL
jgi:hypothetical protein